MALAVGCGKSDEELIDPDVTTDDDIEQDLIEEGEIDLTEGEKIAGLGDGSDTTAGEGSDEDSEDDSSDEDEEDANTFKNSTVLSDGSGIEFNFEAQKTDVNSIPDSAEMTEKAGDLDAARWESLKIYYEGEEADAQEEMDDLRSQSTLQLQASSIMI